MINEAIILAGGLGTRLRSVVADRPKCMALVKDKPFLFYLITYLQHQGINKFIFSVGYMHEVIEEYLACNHASLYYNIALEEEPMGTGGAIKLACKKATSENALVCNGDTLFKIDVEELSSFHKKHNADCSLCLKPMKNFERYGVVELKDDDAVQSFKEKKYYDYGYINGGVYALNVERFQNENLPSKFSFEKDYLEKNSMSANDGKAKLFGLTQDKYFIDIGIPEDYERAQEEF